MRTWLYASILSAGALLGGCQAPAPSGLEELSASQPVAVIADVEPTRSISSRGPPLAIHRHKPTSHSSRASTRYERIEVREQEPPRPEADDDNLPDRLRDLRIHLDYHHLRPNFSSTADYFLDEPRNPFRLSEAAPLPPESSLYGLRDPFTDQSYHSEEKLGPKELRIILETGREIIRRLAKEGYTPMVQIDRFLRYLEKVGDRLKAIEEGIQDIWRIDLSDPVEDLSDPLRKLREALGESSASDKRPARHYEIYPGYRPALRPRIKGSLEPTLNNHPFGARSGQDLIGILEGEERLDLGVQLSFRIDF